MRLPLEAKGLATVAVALLLLPGRPAAASPEPASGSDAVHRIAIVSWSSTGSPGKPALQGSRADAQAIGDLLLELGGTASGDLDLLEATDTTSLLAAFGVAAERIRSDSAAGVASALIFYHAGHANPLGLELGRQTLPWPRLRKAVNDNPARVRVAVLDACASGSILRSRGGRFATPLPEPVRGEAWILSSRPEESSIETDSDGGGIFTRILLGGLRGAADADRDGQVTFDESFRHVSAGVKERARLLGVASQTPQWASSIEGDHPLVLTRVDRDGTSSLEFGPSPKGILVVDSTGKPEAWLPPDTASTRIALPPGLHTAWRNDPDGRKAHRTRISRGETRRILSDEFVATGMVDTAPPPDTALRSVPVNFGLLSPLTLNGEHPEKARNAFSLDLVLGDAGAIGGFQMAGILTRVRRDVHGAQFAGVMNLTQGHMAGFQFSAVNLLGDGVTGVQTGLLLNLDEGDSRGAQIATLMDVNRGGLVGAQASLGSCYAGRLHGGQISLVNVAGSMTGVQAGLLNIARHSRGLQAGLVNISMESRGVSLGVVNVTPRSRSLAVGIVNVGRDLSVHPVVGMSDDRRPQVQVRYQTSWWRSLVLAESPWAHDLLEPDAHRWGIGVGASTQGRIGFGADALLLSRDILDSSPEPAIQCGVEWRASPRIAPGLQVRWVPDDAEAFSAMAYLAI